jgi:hypothetical protein
LAISSDFIDSRTFAAATTACVDHLPFGGSKLDVDIKGVI